MTITRLFFYATFVTCALPTGAVFARDLPQDMPAASTSARAVAASHTVTSASQAHAKSQTSQASKANKYESAKPAKAPARESYRLPHPLRQMDSYQNAVTPPPAANDR